MLDTHIEHERDDAQHSDHKSDKKDLHHWILTDLFSKMLILSGLFLRSLSKAKKANIVVSQLALTQLYLNFVSALSQLSIILDSALSQFCLSFKN